MFKVPETDAYDAAKSMIQSDVDVRRPRLDEVHTASASKQWTLSMTLDMQQQRNRLGEALPMSIGTETTQQVLDDRSLDFGGNCFMHRQLDVATQARVTTTTKLCTDGSHGPVGASLEK